VPGAGAERAGVHAPFQDSGCAHSGRGGGLRRINHDRQWSPVLCSVVAAMPVHSCIPGVFGPEAIAAMGEAFDAACKELGEAGQPEVAREVIAGRIISASRFGERDPLRLREAALRKPD